MYSKSRFVDKKVSSDIDWANDVLRFCIKTLRGENIVSKLEGRVQIVLILKKRLAQEGFWWQVKVLDYWIHRAQRGDFDGS